MPYKTKKLSDKVTKNLLLVKNRLNLSVRRVASVTNKAYSIVSQYFRGTKNPPEAWIDLFCQAYCLDKDWLINGDGEPNFTGEPDKSVITRSSDNVGARIRELRESLGLTQKEFGEKIGMTLQGVFYLEKNKTAPSTFSAAKIEEQFDVGADWIMYGNEEKKEFPLSEKLIKWLWTKPEIRKKLWKEMEREKQRREWDT